MGQLLHQGLVVAHFTVVHGQAAQDVPVGGHLQHDVLDLGDVVGAVGGNEPGAAPVEALGAGADGPVLSGVGALHIGLNAHVQAPGGEEEAEDLGVGAHVLVPLVDPLAGDVVVDALLGVLHGALHPVHHVLIHHHGIAVHPRGGHVVGVHAVSVGPAGVHIVAACLHLLGGLVELIPVGHSGGDGLGIIGTQNGLGDRAAVDQHTGGGLVAQTADLAVGGGHGLQGVLVLVRHVRRSDAQLGDGQSHIHIGINVLQGIVGLHQEHIDLLIGGGGCLLGQSLVQLLLVNAVLVGVDDPMDLGAVLQVGDGLVVGELLHLGVVGVELLLELLVPHIDVEDLAAVVGFAGCSGGVTLISGTLAASGTAAAAAAEKSKDHQRRKCKT